MKFDCRITRSCIYWDDDKRETYGFQIEAESLDEAKKMLYDEAIRLELRSASKLVQDILIKIDGTWTPVQHSEVKPQ